MSNKQKLSENKQTNTQLNKTPQARVNRNNNPQNLVQKIYKFSNYQIQTIHNLSEIYRRTK